MSRRPGESTDGAIPGVSPREAFRRQTEGVLIIDVRQPQEWVAGRIDGAVLMPLDELPDRLEEIPRDRDVVVVCRSGNRSGIATVVMRDAGIDAVNLEGGIQAWLMAGLPSVAG